MNSGRCWDLDIPSIRNHPDPWGLMGVQVTVFHGIEQADGHSPPLTHLP